jgi:hypothetical protein
LSIKKNITRAFLDRFVLSEEEIDFLTSDYSDTEISPIFFAALRRLQTLQNDCKLLLLADRNQAGYIQLFISMCYFNFFKPGYHGVGHHVARCSL